jgi:hypothetical protein
VDLIGENSVAVVTAAWQAASVLLAALAAMLLAAKLAQAGRSLAPAATQQQLARSVLLSNSADYVGVLLARCLPTRAPPDQKQRTSHAPPGILPPQ